MNVTINEAKAFSEIYQFARSLEPALRFAPVRTINEATQFYNSPLIADEIKAYDEHIFQAESIYATLDINKLRAGQDPILEWLKANMTDLAVYSYQQLQEGIWDSLKAAGKAGLEFVGQGVKAAGSAVLRQFPWGQKVIDFLKKFTEGGSPIGIAQLLLDIIGAIPGSWFGFPIDVVANAINAIIYFGRGMNLNGMFSLFFAAMPWIGPWLKATKYAFFKPFSLLADMGKGVATGDKALIQKAGKLMAETAGSKQFLGKIGQYASALATGIKKIIGNIVLVFKKFLPDSWVVKIEEWMTKNLAGPVASTEKAIQIAEDFVAKGGKKNLVKGGEAGLAHELETGVAKAKQGVEVTTSTGAKATTKKAGTILADEAADIATKVTGKIEPKALNEMVMAGNKQGISKLFASVSTEAGLTRAERELMQVFSRSPEVFIECQKISKALYKTIADISRLAGPRKLIKLSRLAKFLARDYFKTEMMCFMQGPYGKFYQLADQYPDGSAVHESFVNEADDVDYTVPDSGETPTSTVDPTVTGATDADAQQTMKQLGKLQFKNADPTTQAEAKQKIAEHDKLGPCAAVNKQGGTSTGNAYVNAMITQTPYGDVTVPSDAQQADRFNAIVKPELERIGIPPPEEYVHEKLYSMGTHQRAKYIDVYDPVKNVVSITTSQEQEDERFEAFIKSEAERTGLPEARVRAIVNQVKKENHQLDQQLSDTTQQQTNQ